MPVTSKTIGQMQLDDLVEGVHGIYSSKDAKRSLWDVWMHTNHHASGIAEEVRKGNHGDDLLREVADCAMWLFTMVEKLQGQIGLPKSPDSPQESLIRIAISYSDMLWKRYPSVCPFCYWRRTAGTRQREQEPGFSDPCDCASHVPEKLDSLQKRLHARALNAFSRDNLARKPQQVDEWQKMFGTIFAASLKRSSPQIALHLLEEMGEVSDALTRTYSYSESSFVPDEPSWRQFRLEEELSDVSSRLFVLAQKLNSEAHRDDALLSQIIWHRYGSDALKSFVCWKCGKTSCSCQIIIVPLDRSIEELRGLIKSDENTRVE